jgi:ribonuclease BN (tRNA processing enzyme)
VRITVLGKSPSWQDAGGACSGYLVQSDGATLLLDCGNGVFGKLRAVCDYMDVDAVVISHLHADHMLDLVPFSYALRYSPRAPRAQEERPVLHAPIGARDTFRRVVGAWGSEDLIEGAFDLREYAVQDTLVVGGLRVRFALVPHFTTTHAVEVSAAGGRRFVFGADSGPTDVLAGFARDADLLVLEATLVEPEPETDIRGHLTATEAGEHAREAGAHRLVLSHISDELDQGRALTEASAAFGAQVEIAADGAVYDI